MAQCPRIEVIRRYRAHGRNQLPVQIPNGHLSKVSCSQQVHKGPGLSDIASNAERNPVIEDGLVIPGPAKAAVLPGMSFSLLSINIRYEVEIWLSVKRLYSSQKTFMLPEDQPFLIPHRNVTTARTIRMILSKGSDPAI